MERSLKAKATFEKMEAMDGKNLNVKKAKYIYMLDYLLHEDFQAIISYMKVLF